jgi:hypothetical protein
LPDALTDVLVAPPCPVEPATWAAARDAARALLTTSAAAGTRPGDGRFRVTEHDIRTAMDDGSSAASAAGGAFAWTARTARRPIGLAAVRALVAGDAATPVEAVRSRVAESSRLVHGGSHRASPLDGWLAGLSPAGRSAVGAEAVTWCTRLWTGVDWDALGTRLVIGRDHWWDSPQSALLALRGRAEVRTDRAHLVVLSGPRRASVRAELGLVLLVEALRARDDVPRGRVVGWWSDSGHLARVEAEPAVLTLAAEAVTRVLAHGPPVPGAAAAQPAA